MESEVQTTSSSTSPLLSMIIYYFCYKMANHKPREREGGGDDTRARHCLLTICLSIRFGKIKVFLISVSHRNDIAVEMANW